MSEWIKCSEQMPPSGQKVLVCLVNSHGKYRIRIGFYTKGGEIDYDSEQCPDFICNACENDTAHYLNEGWYQEIDDHGSCDGVYDNLNNVTHWMLLPEHPKD